MRILLILLFLFTFTLPVTAQDAVQAPAAVTALMKEKSTATYLGEQENYQTWLLTGPEQKQVVYLRNGEAVAISGTMTDTAGENLSAKQLLQAAAEGKLSEVAEIQPFQEPNQYANQGLGDRFFNEIATLRPLKFGPDGAKAIYVFMDPTCSHCHAFYKAVQEQISAGKQVQMLILPAPILGKDSRDKVLRTYAAPDSAAAWHGLMDGGDLGALPDDEAMKTAAENNLKANLKTMIRWQIKTVPTVVWRAADGRVMITYGTPKNIQELWHSLGIE